MATPPKNPEPSGTSAEAESSVPAGGASEAARQEADALACIGAELLRRATESQPALQAAWNELMTRWGIRGEPVGVQRLRAMIQAESGSNPDDNALTRELIALRAERHS
jgi:hypothetical protein